MTHWETSIWLKCLRTFRHGDHVSPIIHHSTSSHIAPHYPDIIPHIHNRVMHPAMFSRARHIIHHRVEAKNLRARGQKHSRKPWSRKPTMSAGRFILGFYLITKSNNTSHMHFDVLCSSIETQRPMPHISLRFSGVSATATATFLSFSKNCCMSALMCPPPSITWAANCLASPVMAQYFKNIFPVASCLWQPRFPLTWTWFKHEHLSHFKVKH